MLLSHLLAEIQRLPASAEREINRLQLDSRHIQPGDLFVALKGTHTDGRDFIPTAIGRGASAVILTADSPDAEIQLQDNVPLIPVYQLQQQLGFIAARFYGYPARTLRLFGVTGTNGKTSCSHFLAQMLTALNIPCGIIGTLGSGFYGHLGPVGLTTPDPVTLQAMLQSFQQQGAGAVAMEVSSHSIHQGRVNGIDFEIGIFTNLTQDHLDYHGDMASYAAVKQRFLVELPTREVILNVDDAYGQSWLSELTQIKKVYTYSLISENATIFAKDIKLTLKGMTATVHTPWGEGQLAVPLIGRFNLSNALAVLAALCAAGFPLATVLEHMATLNPVPGRMQTITGPKQPLIVVDYSHTPDALENALKALRVHTQGKLWCVFGCGGDRDQTKRPLMAKIAETFADEVIVTNDNPRHEDPETIAQQVMRGFTQPERVLLQLDRAKAIQKSIQCATELDCILIAGKGAERYQQIGDEKIPFDDIAEAKHCLGMVVQHISGDK